MAETVIGNISSAIVCRRSDAGGIASRLSIAAYRCRISWKTSASVTRRSRLWTAWASKRAARSLSLSSLPTRYIGTFVSTRITGVLIALLDLFVHLRDIGGRKSVRCRRSDCGQFPLDILRGGVPPRVTDGAADPLSDGRFLCASGAFQVAPLAVVEKDL